MNNKKLILSVFILVVMAQIFVPAKMILDREDVIKTGKEFKFKVEPVDPNDPFRGKYINLYFNENTTHVQNESDWIRNEIIYVMFTTDNDGYAKIHSVFKEEPTDSEDFIETKVRYISSDSSNRLTVEYPFDRYYMEETKAKDAELNYMESLNDSSQVTYALVFVKNGSFVLKDVLINGVSIKDIIRKETE